ncbi:MAG: transcription termination factor NusA [Candidatus Omnitrophica bacterium]|nr:transcription termination factor NusA [Candidatus Omnitrophota bacterium]MBU1047703.1 transcription termination factor NusA [Candidatus Omnitrophota bacterium]MBU1630501.1 transcription termination factor NusA [Candidatus Omnitrophota bacterium]MBU1767139.1 transcription termination factor NusA [Candidatus Omnitrophota bacterium]MBU1888567.1 transcription termination factor NusA [Candidatus Omnitrophota bacterium]
MKNEILATLESLGKEKGLNKEVLIEAVKDAVLSAAKKKFRGAKDVSVIFQQDTGDIKVVIDGQEKPLGDLGRIAAQSAKHIMVKEIRQHVSEKVYATYQSRIGQILTGRVEAMDGRDFIIELGEIDGLLPRQECLPQDNFRIGDNVKAYLFEIKREINFAPLLFSRTHPRFLDQLFRIEVPEIKEGIIEIKAIVREAGYRAKIAVESHMKNVDPIGTCIGLKGERVRAITQELNGEKIDIIPYDKDMKIFIARALAPAKVLDIQIFSEDKRARIIVEDDQLSLAIGKKGQNVRLAAKLTGWKLDIRSKTQTEKEKKFTPKGIEKELTQLPGIGIKMANSLGKAGLITIEDIAKSTPENLLNIPGLGEAKAVQIINKAKEIIGNNPPAKDKKGEKTQ